VADPRGVGVRGFGSVLGGVGTVYLYDPSTGRVGVIDATRNDLAGRTTIAVPGGVGAADAPVLAEQRGALWLVTGPGRLTRDDLPTGSTTELTLPTDVVSEQAAGGPPAPGATPVVADDDAAWGVYELGVAGNPAVPAAGRIAAGGGLTGPAAAPGCVRGGALRAPAGAHGGGVR